MSFITTITRTFVQAGETVIRVFKQYEVVQLTINRILTGVIHTIQNTGTDLPQRMYLNFKGSGVTATDNETNDATDIEINSTAQVQSDYTQSDNSQVDFIKNKPTIPVIPAFVDMANGEYGNRPDAVFHEIKLRENAVADVFAVEIENSNFGTNTVTLNTRELIVENSDGTNPVLEIYPRHGIDAGNAIYRFNDLAGIGERAISVNATGDLQVSTLPYFSDNTSKSSAADAGTQNQLAVDDDYLYICTTPGTAGNAVWKKAILVNT